MEQLMTWDTALIGAGLIATSVLWMYTHFSKATQAEQAQRLSAVATLVSYAYHASSDVAAKTEATWDDRLAAILGRVDAVLKAQGDAQLDLGEKAKAALQVAALTGARNTGLLLASPLPPQTPR